MNDIDMKLIISGAVLVASGGIAWGTLRTKVINLADKFRKCKTEELMTVDRCRDFHDARQATTAVQLSNIEGMLKEMKGDRRKFDERLGALTSKLDVLDDRWGRANG